MDDREVAKTFITEFNRRASGSAWIDPEYGIDTMAEMLSTAKRAAARCALDKLCGEFQALCVKAAIETNPPMWGDDPFKAGVCPLGHRFHQDREPRERGKCDYTLPDGDYCGQAYAAHRVVKR